MTLNALSSFWRDFGIRMSKEREIDAKSIVKNTGLIKVKDPAVTKESYVYIIVPQKVILVNFTKDKDN